MSTSTITYLDDGLGGGGLDQLSAATRLYTQGTIYYVHHDGADTNDGLDPARPKATTAAAVALLAAGDMLVWLDGHTETFTTAVNMSDAEVILVGLGTGDDGEPSVVLTPAVSVAATTMLRLSGASAELRNVRIAAATTAMTGAALALSGAGSRAVGCVIEGGGLNQAALVEVGNQTTLDGCALRSVADASDALPAAAITVPGGCQGTHFRSLVFDGGDHGWTSVVEMQVGVGAALSYAAFDGVTLINTDLSLTSDVTGWVQFVSIDDRSSFKWDQGAVSAGILRHLPSGVGASGDSGLVSPNGPFFTNKVLIWCHYGSGSDTNDGLARSRPKKTLSAALTAAGATGTVVLLQGHVEPKSSGFATTAAGQTIIGCGSSAGAPMCKLLRTSGDGTFSFDHSFCKLYNVAFPRSAVVSGTTQSSSSTTSLVAMGASDYSRVFGCRFEAGYASTTPLTAAIDLDSGSSSTGHWIDDCTIVAAGTSSVRPVSGVIASSTSASAERTVVTNLVLDGGAYGFSGWAFDGSPGSAANFRMFNLQLLRGATAYLSDRVTRSVVSIGAATGGAELLWDTV